MRVRHLKNKLKIVVAILFVAFCSSCFSVPSALAATNYFKVQSVSLEAAEGSIMDFDETGIASNVTLKKLNDFVKYTITIKNTDDKSHTIENITDDNASPYIAYEYDSHTNEEIAPGSDLVLVVTAKYVSYIADPNDDTHTNDVRFKIQFADLTEEVAVPNTGDETTTMSGANSDSFLNAAMFIVFAIGLVVVNILASRKKLKYTIIIAVIALAATASSTVKAATIETSEFTLTTNFTLGTGRLIHYDGNWEDDGEMTDSYWTMGGKLSPNAFIAEGYHFAGWSLEPDEEKVYDDEESMDNIPDSEDPLTLYVVWEPNIYTVVFHANSERATGDMAPMTDVEYCGRRRPLTYNDFVLDGYRFTGWKEDNECDLIPDHSSATYFAAEHGGTVHLYAQWEEVPDGIDYYKNGSDVAGITYRQENFGESTMLRTQNYKRDGYGFAGWNTEPDGSGAMYGPNETVALPEGGLKLYAAWVKAEDGVTMQSFDGSAELYASYPNGKVIALEDNRDGQVYAVAKLADGKWWMMENLRLVPTGIQFTAENTNNPTPAFLTATITSHLCKERTDVCINQFAYQSSALDKIEYSSSMSLNWYGNGVYYNVFAATAGHAAVGGEDQETGQVAGDICPKGWHLPSGGRDGDFSTLDLALGGNGTNFAGDIAHAQKYFQAPINLVVSGWAEGLYYRNIGSDAVYLERDTNGMEHNVGVFVDNAIDIIGETNEKYNAYTVRCLAND